MPKVSSSGCSSGIYSPAAPRVNERGEGMGWNLSPQLCSKRQIRNYRIMFLKGNFSRGILLQPLVHCSLWICLIRLEKGLKLRRKRVRNWDVPQQSSSRPLQAQPGCSLRVTFLRVLLKICCLKPGKTAYHRAKELHKGRKSCVWNNHLLIS